MAKKKAHLGSDPLGFIHDTRAEGKPDKHSNLGNNDILDNSSNIDLQSKHSILSKHNILDNSEIHSLPKKTAQQGLPDGWMRSTFIIREKHLEQIKALAYWERKEIKEVVDEMLTAFLKPRKIEPVPPKHKAE